MRSSRSNPVWYLPVSIGALLMLFPIWWMLVVSLKTEADAKQSMSSGEMLQVLPGNPQWGNYAQAVSEVGTEPVTGFLDALANSIVVTVLVVAATILSSSLVATAFARIRFRGRNGFFILMLATMMLPAQVTMIPLFLFFRSLGWVDTLLPLVVPAFFGSAFFIFMYRQFIAQIPESLFEAARIDRCGWFEIWWRIVLPLSRPVTAITAVFTFIFVWNDFMTPLIYLHSEEQATIAVALNSFRTQFSGIEDVHLLMALSVVTMVPCIVLFFAAQRHFIEGLGSGAVKG
ncbi:MAG: carbohydrate ABC transporter permease [Phycisphaerales bacterium]|nr:carbohydrate ABC transporter permease [Phycisphaerales bacterium]